MAKRKGRDVRDEAALLGRLFVCSIVLPTNTPDEFAAIYRRVLDSCCGPSGGMESSKYGNEQYEFYERTRPVIDLSFEVE